MGYFFLTNNFILIIILKKLKRMSRIDELKKQFPELNITMFDLFKRIDTSNTYKYFPILCKILGSRFSVKNEYANNTVYLSESLLRMHSDLLDKGVSTNNLTDNELFTLNYFSDYFITDHLITVRDFIRYMDKNLIQNKDVTSYSTIDDLRAAITVASMKEFNKDLEGQIVKEFEDDKWLIVRPLTFQSSSKYGATTRWCTTYKQDKHYFQKYWERGILVYFINKQSGYKFAGYKALKHDDEFSFWNAEDNRVDYLSVESDDYLYSIVRQIFKSNKTNKDLCSEEIAKQVMKECGYNIKTLDRENPIEGIEVQSPRYMGEAMMGMDEQIREEIDRDVVRQLREVEREHYPEDSISEPIPMRA
jgi:uncharacterized protein (DUF433 family)